MPQLDAPDNDNRPENTFAVEDGDGENTVFIYFRQQGSGTRVFQISYRVENAVKLYSDVGEFFWNLTGETGISDIGTLTAALIVPEGVPEEEFRIWAHGPLNGTFEKQSDDYAFLQVDNVPVGTIVDLRCTLPADCFYGGWEQQGEALSRILAEEKALADSANAKREEEARRKAEQEAALAEYVADRDAWKAKHPILSFAERICEDICYSVRKFLENYGETILIAVFLGMFLGIFILIGTFQFFQNVRHRSIRRRTRLRPAQSPRYYRDLPDERPAPAVDRLLHFYDGRSDLSRQISAALLELNLKKLIRFRTADRDTVLLLNEPLGEEMFPSSAPQEPGTPARKHTPGYQEALWVFLRDAAGGNGQIALSEFKKYIADNQAAALHFRSSFENAVEKDFQKKVKTKDVERYWPMSRKNRLIVAAAAGVIALLIRMLSTAYTGFEYGDSFKVGLITFVLMLFVQGVIRFVRIAVENPCYILDQQGEDDLALWQAFGRFLDDFTTFEDKELPEFSVWREYMVYAVAMGNGRKVAKALAVKYPEAVSAGTALSDDDLYRWLQDMALYDAMDSIGREVAEIKAPPSSSSSSSDGGGSWSDSSGGGGGFSDSGGGSDSGSGGDFID